MEMGEGRDVLLQNVGSAFWPKEFYINKYEDREALYPKPPLQIDK